jgi:dTDP-4-dehydrorhamnose 3,5-epimerase
MGSAMPESVSSIEGIEWFEPRTHGDHRGFFRELIRADGSSASRTVRQVSHSLVHAGIVKGWHGHAEQHQWTYVVSGALWVVLFDARPGSPTLGRFVQRRVAADVGPVVYGFPPGILHGYRCLSEAQVIYLTSGTYDLADEVRVPVGDPSVPYSFERLTHAS